MPNTDGLIRPALPERPDTSTNCGVEYLARGAQQQAERERAGRGEAKNREVAMRMHGFTIARRAAIGKHALGLLGREFLARLRAVAQQQRGDVVGFMLFGDVKGRSPDRSWAFGSAPASSSTSTASSNPISTASSSAVAPRASPRSRDAPRATRSCTAGRFDSSTATISRVRPPCETTVSTGVVASIRASAVTLPSSITSRMSWYCFCAASVRQRCTIHITYPETP